jgi:uncharacterized membrane protein YfcA
MLIFSTADFSLYFLGSIVIAATLYASVGHGGASGYLAMMALFGLDPSLMKPAALTMNIFVTVLVLSRLNRAGHFNWRLFLPFVIASMPMAFIGGAYTINSSAYKIIVGSALLLAVLRMIWQTRDNYELKLPPIHIAMLVGAILGFLSGLTGVGGGIFLSPLLLLFHWTNMRGSAAIAAGFILLNSIAGLAGYATTDQLWPEGIPTLVIAALIGGAIGSELGVHRLAPLKLRKALALVLAVAGIKMIVTA